MLHALPGDSTPPACNSDLNGKTFNSGFQPSGTGFFFHIKNSARRRFSDFPAKPGRAHLSTGSLVISWGCRATSMVNIYFFLVHFQFVVELSRCHTLNLQSAEANCAKISCRAICVSVCQSWKTVEFDMEGLMEDP